MRNVKNLVRKRYVKSRSIEIYSFQVLNPAVWKRKIKKFGNEKCKKSGQKEICKK